MTGLVGLIQHQGIPLNPIKVSDVLLLLHRPENIEHWDPKDPMTAFWDISGQVGWARNTCVAEGVGWGSVVVKEVAYIVYAISEQRSGGLGQEHMRGGGGGVVGGVLL